MPLPSLSLSLSSWGTVGWGDVALLFAICSGGFDGVNLLPVTEGNLDAESAVGGQGNFFAADGETGGGVGGAVDDQFSIRDKPERALAGSDASNAGLTATAGPEADAGVAQSVTIGICRGIKTFLEFLGSNATTPEVTRCTLVKTLVQATVTGLSG